MKLGLQHKVKNRSESISHFKFHVHNYVSAIIFTTGHVRCKQ